MTKQELLDAVHEAAGGELAKKALAEIIDATFDIIAQSVVTDSKFYMPGFGTWQVKERKARVGRNPRTGEQIQIAASKTVGFKAAQALKDSI